MLALCFHIAWACNFFASFGLVGFARADEVTAIHTQLNSIQQAQLEGSIQRDRSAQCHAFATKNGDALAIVDRELQKFLAQYQTMTQHPYQLLPCDPV